MLEVLLAPDTFPQYRLGDLVLQFAKNGCDVSRYHFDIEPHVGRMGESLGNIRWDTQYGLTLTGSVGRRRPHLAVLGMRPVADALLIEQIQSRWDKESPIRSLRWERLLVSAVVTFAAKSGVYRQVCIQTASRTAWFSDPVGIFPLYERNGVTLYVFDNGRTLEEYQADMKRRYDGTARGLHFKWSRDKKMWLYPLRSG